MLLNKFEDYNTLTTNIWRHCTESVLYLKSICCLIAKVTFTFLKALYVASIHKESIWFLSQSYCDNAMLTDREEGEGVQEVLVGGGGWFRRRGGAVGGRGWPRFPIQWRSLDGWDAARHSLVHSARHHEMLKHLTCLSNHLSKFFIKSCCYNFESHNACTETK